MVVNIIIEHRIYLLLNIYMNTSQEIDSVTIMQRQRTTTSIYSNKVCQNYHFRILTNQYQNNSNAVLYTTFMWTIYAFALSILIISQHYYSQYHPFFVTVSIGNVPLNALVIYNKKIFGKGFVITSILFNLITIAISVLLWLQLPYLGFAFGIYLLLQLTLNCVMMENKGKIMLKTVVFMQILIICLKMDELITLEWSQALFGFAIISLFLATAGLCIIVYSFLISCSAFREIYHEIKREGLRYLALNIINFAFIISIPLWTEFINYYNEIPVIIALALTILTPIFSFWKRAQINLYLCNTIQIAAKEDNAYKIQFKNTIERKSLFQVSDNWFTEEYDRQICEENVKIQDCVACMDCLSEYVWLPCGHCTLCSKCVNQLINANIINCPLCKSKPTQIAKLAKKDKDMISTILHKNEYQVSDCFVIKSI